MHKLFKTTLQHRLAMALKLGLFLVIILCGKKAHAQSQCTTQYNACVAQALSDYNDCFSDASGAGQRHACVAARDSADSACTAAYNSCQAPATITGFINPKFVIVGLTYAPPGGSSTVSYASSTLVGNTTDLSSSYTTSSDKSVSVTHALGGWSVIGGAAVTVGSTASTNLTQGTNTTSSVTLSKTTSLTQTTQGVANSFAPVNHDYDLIWLWLNPLMIYTVNPSVPDSLEWDGYGFDPDDIPETDIYPVYLGYLNGHFGPNPSVASVLARTWASGQTWPTGQGPGLTATDLANIAAADPFSSGAYALPTPLPTTSPDGRFTLAALTQSVPYVQGGPGSSSGPTTTYSLSNTATSALGQGSNYSYSQTFGTNVGFGGGTFFTHYQFNLQTANTITMATKWQRTLTNTVTNTNNLTVVGPACPATSAPCVPTYTGPGEFVVYQDNLYGSFLFYPN